MKLTDDERAWVQAQLALVDKFVGDYGGGEHGLAGVDRAWGGNDRVWRCLVRAALLRV